MDEALCVQSGVASFCHSLKRPWPPEHTQSLSHSHMHTTMDVCKCTTMHGYVERIQRTTQKGTAKAGDRQCKNVWILLITLPFLRFLYDVLVC